MYWTYCQFLPVFSTVLAK